MSDTPQSSINWERKFSLPVAVGLDEDDLGLQGLVMDDYFTAAGVKAVALGGVNPGIIYKIINGKTTLLPIFSNCANAVPTTIDQTSIQSAMDRLLPAEGEFFSLDADERIAKYFAKASVILEHRHGSLLPLPYDPPFSLHISWPKTPAAINANMTGSYAGIDLDGFAFGSYYMLETSSSVQGELDPLLVRSMLSGLATFERYRHFKYTNGSLTGGNQSNTGRLVLINPDFISYSYGDSAGRVLKTISGVCYEHMDASYTFSRPGVITARPVIANCFRNILVLHLTYFNNYKDYIQNGVTSATGKEEYISRITGVLYSYVQDCLLRLLRSWAAYSTFVTTTSEIGDIDSVRQAALKSDAAIDDDTLAAIIDDMTRAHSEGDTSSSWAYLLQFIENTYVPKFLGSSWFELGVNTDLLPVYNDNSNGWWRSAANQWAGHQLNRMELLMGNSIPVFPGASLAQPAKYFKKKVSDLDDAAQLENGAGLSVFDLEAIALCGNIADTEIPTPVTIPAQLYEYFRLSDFQALEVGYQMTLRPYQVNSENFVVKLSTVPYENFIAELLELGGNGPALAITEAYEHHPLVSASLAILPENNHIIARRDDGQTATLETGSLLEVKIGIDYSQRENYIVDTVLADLAKVYLRISLDNGTTAANYIQLLDFSEKAAYESSGFQFTRYVIGSVEPLKNGWNEDEQVEWFLVSNCYDYETKFLVIDNEAARQANFYFWFFAGQHNSLGALDLDLFIGLFFDADNLLTFHPGLKLNNRVFNIDNYPVTFQEGPSKLLKFDVPNSTEFNQSKGKTGPGGSYYPEAQYLDQFIWGQGGDQTEPAYQLYLKWQAHLANKAAIQAAAHAEAVAAGIASFPQAFDRIDWKMHETGTTSITQNGLYIQLLPALVHDRLRVAQNVHDRIVQEYTAYGLDPAAALPSSAIMSLWGIEGSLNLAPSLPMLRIGVPPPGHSPENIDIFGSQAASIKDLIYCDNTAAAVGFSEVTYDSLSKATIIRLKADASGWYVLNLLSMDAYNGFTSAVTTAAEIGLQKHGFVKTVMHTRQLLNILSRKGAGVVQQDVEVIQKGYQTWYQLTGNLSICFGFVPQNGIKMGFGAAKDGTKLNELWVYEAAMHYSACIRGPLLTGYQLQFGLPYCLAYVRFNFGDYKFLYRIFEIIKNSYTFAVADLALGAAGKIGSGVFPPDVGAFLTTLGTAHFGTTAPIAANFSDPPDFPGTRDLTKVRRDDTAADSAGGPPTSFDLLEEQLNQRTYDTVSADTYINTYLRGATEQAMHDHFVANPGDLNTMLAWMDSDPDYWTHLAEFFMTSTGAAVVTSSPSVAGFYDTARWMQIKTGAFAQLFA
jgi:hypothetical protein